MQGARSTERGIFTIRSLGEEWGLRRASKMREERHKTARHKTQEKIKAWSAEFIPPRFEDARLSVRG